MRRVPAQRGSNDGGNDVFDATSANAVAVAVVVVVVVSPVVDAGAVSLTTASVADDSSVTSLVNMTGIDGVAS
jgi:hypothetical protein